jgi:hypothetical protein
MIVASIMRGKLVLLAGCWAAILPGCSRQEPSPPYQVLSGVVRAIDVETGELLIRAEKTPAPWHPDRNVPCIVTKDSELYINDRFSELRNVRLYDTLEAIGYRDRDRFVFVLSLVNITRQEPEPPLPAFVVKLTTRPATSKHED